MLDSPERILGLAAVVLGIVATGTGLWLGLRKQARALASLVDAVLGHEEARDRSGAVYQPAQPGLAARLAAMDAKVDRLIALDRRVTNLEDSHANLAGRVSVLEDSRVERVVTQAESTAVWRAVEAANTRRDPDDAPPSDS